MRISCLFVSYQFSVLPSLLVGQSNGHHSCHIHLFALSWFCDLDFDLGPQNCLRRMEAAPVLVHDPAIQPFWLHCRLYSLSSPSHFMTSYPRHPRHCGQTTHTCTLSSHSKKTQDYFQITTRKVFPIGWDDSPKLSPNTNTNDLIALLLKLSHCCPDWLSFHVT